MKPRRLVFLGLGLAAVIFVFAISLNLLPGKAPADQAQNGPSSTVGGSASPSPRVSASGVATAPATSKDSAKPANPTAKATATAAAQATKGGPAASPDPAKPLEVNTPAPKPTKLVLPTSKPRLPLVSAPLPKSADAAGKLANGYPEKAVPPTDGSKITSSSVSPQGTILQTSLVANTTDEPLAVKAFYLAHFAPLGFGAADAPAPAGSTATWFVRGSDKITLTVTSVKGGASYIVYGVLHTGN